VAVGAARDTYERRRCSADVFISRVILIFSDKSSDYICPIRAGAFAVSDGPIWPVFIISQLLDYWTIDRKVIFFAHELQ
jgi:hypothetical protein